MALVRRFNENIENGENFYWNWLPKHADMLCFRRDCDVEIIFNDITIVVNVYDGFKTVTNIYETINDQER
jgi:hypothetical protein